MAYGGIYAKTTTKNKYIINMVNHLVYDNYLKKILSVLLLIKKKYIILFFPN